MFYYTNILLLFTYKIHKLPLKTVSSNNILAFIWASSGDVFTSVGFLLSHRIALGRFIVKVIN